MAMELISGSIERLAKSPGECIFDQCMMGVLNELKVLYLVSLLGRHRLGVRTHALGAEVTRPVHFDNQRHDHKKRCKSCPRNERVRACFLFLAALLTLI